MGMDGAPDLADPNTIYEIENYDDPTWGYTEGARLMSTAIIYGWRTIARPEPYVAWVHKSSFGGSGTNNVPLEIDQSDHGVTVSRWIMDAAPSPYYAKLVKFSGSCDRLQHYEMLYPAIGVNRSIFTPSGTGGRNTQSTRPISMSRITS